MFKLIQCSCRVAGVTLALLWLFQSSAVAGIYKWRDDQGKLHFTDSKSKIPLKYRGNIQKFKGVVEPKPEPVAEPPAAVEEEKETVPEPEAVNEKTAEEKAAEEKAAKEKAAQLVAALKETQRFLENENLAHERLMKFVEPTEVNGLNYMNEVRRRLSEKKRLIEKLSKFEAPSLVKANAYLTESAALDDSEQIGGKGYLERILALRQRMKTQIENKKKIIRRIQKQIRAQRDKENAK